MATKIKLLKIKTRRSLPREIVIQDINNEQSKKIVNYDVNNTIQIKGSIAHCYQKEQDVNFVLTNEKIHEFIFLASSSRTYYKFHHITK